jgi:uncharacterized protein
MTKMTDVPVAVLPRTPDMPPGFHLLAKPSGSTCNIETYIRQLLESHLAPQITVAWQGGEPTLMKLDFSTGLERAGRDEAGALHADSMGAS